MILIGSLIRGCAHAAIIHGMSDMFTMDRALHCRAVALYMQGAAPALGLQPDEAFVVGWLHDAAYAFGDNRSHACNGGRVLEADGYRYWREIALHGTPQGLFSPMGVLLNIADMSVDSQGRTVGFDRRLEDVQTRYGAQSAQYHECAHMISLLQHSHEWAVLRTI